MCTYRNLLYMERWDTAIERCTAIYEVDVNGLPIKRVLHTRIVPSKSLQDDTGWRLRRMFVLAPFVCACQESFYNWPDAQDHLQTTCPHIDIDEFSDGSGHCNDCGLDLAAPKDGSDNDDGIDDLELS